MKNFKKVLALVLAIATLLSFATVASAKTADFADAKDVKNVEAVDVLSYIKVLEGYPADNTFKPAKNITREEAAKIIAIFANKSTDISSLYTSANPFADMKGRWGESYVAYGYRAGIIAGKNATSFVPKANVKGTEFLKMVLVVLGYDQNKEGLVGSSWAVNTLELAKAKKLLAGLGKDFDANAALTRDQAAQIMLNALKAEKVVYGQTITNLTWNAKTGYWMTTNTTANAVYVSPNGAVNNYEHKLLAADFNLTLTETQDKWGRPTHTWNKGTATIGEYVDSDKLVKSYYTAVTECDIANDVGFKTEKIYPIFVNGQTPVKYNVQATDTVAKLGAQGRLTEVYEDRIVMIDTFLAQVESVKDATYDAQGHLRTEATIKLDVYATKGSTAATTLTLTNGEDAYPYAVGDYVLLNAYTNAANNATESGLIKTGADKYGEIVSKATSIDGAQSVIYYNAKQHNVEGTVYDDAAKFYFDNAVASTNKFTWFFDQYNNLIGNVEIAAATSYGVINSIWWAGNAADGSGVAKANVTYMDGTTAVVDLSKMTYFDDTASGVVAPKIASGKVTHSTGIQNKVMKVDGDYFYVDSYINTNAVCDVNGILNGHLFQFTTQANGTLAAVEVATGVDAKFFNENLFVSKNTQYNGKNLIVDDATVFLVRNNTTNPYTFKSIVGLGNIDNYAQAEVDFVDLNGDKVADYVYVIADPVAAKVTSLFYYANEQVSYDAKTGVYTIPGYVDGVKGNIYGSKDDAIVLTLLNALRTQATNKVAGGLFKVALSNNYVKDYVAIAAIGTATTSSVDITAFTGYPMAAAYAGYTVKVDSIVGARSEERRVGKECRSRWSPYH